MKSLGALVSGLMPTIQLQTLMRQGFLEAPISRDWRSQSRLIRREPPLLTNYGLKA